MSFCHGFCKIAVVDLPEEARGAAVIPMQDYVPGSRLEKETGQGQTLSVRSANVLREDKEFGRKFRRDWKNSR